MSRYVLNTFGSLGDLHPFLAVGRALRARGHAVVLATHADYRERIETAGLAFHAVPPALADVGDLDATLRRAMHRTRGTYEVIHRLCLPHVRGATEAMRAALRDADVLLSHPLSFGAVLAAESLGVPRAHAILQPITTYSCADPPYAPDVPLVEALLGRDPGRWRAAYRLVRALTRGWFREVDALRRELRLPPDRGHPLVDMASPRLNVALFSPVLMDPQPDWPPHTVVTGFPRYDRDERGGGAPPELTAFLAAGEPPVVFTLGSSGVFDAGGFYDEAVRATRALGRRAVLLCGPDGRNRSAATQGADVLALDYAPHSELFPHAAVNVLSGGIGTTGTALAAGRPMLFVPLSHDQPDNAARCRRLGLARIVPRGAWRAERAAAELRALLADHDAAARAAEIGARVRAEDGAVAAADALERFAGAK